MNPQQPYNPFEQSQVPDPSIDYLNQIAPQGPPSKKFSTKQLLLIFGGLGIALIGFIAILVSNSAPSNTQNMQRLGARLVSTAKVVEESQKNIKSGDLSSLNSTLRIDLKNTAAGMIDYGIDGNKVEKAIAASEDSTELLEKLDDARLSGTFDRVYAREISFKLEMIVALMNQVHASTDNAKFKAYLESSFKSLEPLQKQFSDFSASTS